MRAPLPREMVIYVTKLRKMQAQENAFPVSPAVQLHSHLHVPPHTKMGAKSEAGEIPHLLLFPLPRTKWLWLATMRMGADNCRCIPTLPSVFEDTSGLSPVPTQ